MYSVFKLQTGSGNVVILSCGFAKDDEELLQKYMPHVQHTYFSLFNQ